MRVESDRQTRDGQGWIHLLDASAARSSVPAPRPMASPKPETVERASIKRRHAIYTAFLAALDLSTEHLDSLEQRGLARMESGRLQLKSTLARRAAFDLACALSQRFDLCGVPGFYREAGNWRLSSIATIPGFFIPYCDEQGRIEGLQVRRWPHAGAGKYIWLSSKDRPLGASSRSPVHFARPELLAHAHEVLLTEGGLKAQIISFFTQAPVIAAAGTSNFSADFGVRLRSLFPALRRTIIAFDKDALEKPQGKRALMRLTHLLERARFTVRIRTWPTADKGYDDFLLSQIKRQEVAA